MITLTADQVRAVHGFRAIQLRDEALPALHEAGRLTSDEYWRQFLVLDAELRSARVAMEATGVDVYYGEPRTDEEVGQLVAEGSMTTERAAKITERLITLRAKAAEQRARINAQAKL